MFFGGCGDVHVDNATPVKYCIFHRVLERYAIFALPTNLGKSTTFSLKKLRKSHENRSQHARPCPTPLWRAFGSILAPFWSPFGSHNRPKARPKRLKSAPRGDSRCFLAVSGGVSGRSWVLLGRLGALRALLGVPPRLFGTIFSRIWHGFGGPYGKGRRHSQRALVKKMT